MKTKSLFLIPSAVLFAAAIAFAGPQAAQPVQASSVDKPQSQSPVQYPTTVVELFTSQGCSSCPPANKLVREIAQTDGVLALSYSVDYWDYLGWKDTLGSPEFSQRQRKYGKQQFQGQVYTPQIVLNGDRHGARFKPDLITSHKLVETPVHIEFNDSVDGLMIKTSGQSGTLMEIRYTPGTQSVPVARGENRGRTITLANVVTSIKPLGSLKQGDEFEAILTRPENGEAVAVLVQDGEGGPILTAAAYTP